MTHKLSHILREHANSMHSEGWYTTAFRLDEAAERIEHFEREIQWLKEALQEIASEYTVGKTKKKIARKALAKLGGDDD